MNKKPIIVILKIGIFVVLLYLTHHPLNITNNNRENGALIKKQALAKKASLNEYNKA